MAYQQWKISPCGARIWLSVFNTLLQPPEIDLLPHWGPVGPHCHHWGLIITADLVSIWQPLGALWWPMAKDLWACGDVWDPLKSALRLVRPCYARLCYHSAVVAGGKIFAAVLIVPHTRKTTSDRWSVMEPMGPFYQDGLTLITARISNHMLSKVWVEIT